MTITVPDDWEAEWIEFDRRMETLKAAAGANGISRADVSSVMRVGLPCAATNHPSWCAWAAVRHQATDLSTIQDIACGAV